ncbi:MULTISPECIES: glycoside hydrolase family 2 TIM barrel-domain containing protein [unclassified Actinomyces]|uniref:glycoside hydrolase family 2 TIM barrel-domain containing protein n=1 Tax=unclassified Actinomyces TaxID=2609248 RepID=UPI000D59A678|nr:MULTISPECIES: glycoside hydrolase family 2 TIM barrel-domain containing protein [unclassified Actinomyces]RAX23657.1 glycoside hydrolase family 2 protein [Actinomyces sp. Z3]
MKRTDLNRGWTFRENTGAFASLLGAAPTRGVDLPHDAVLAGGRDPGSENQGNNAYFRSGAWVYEKTIDVPAQWRDRRVTLEFEGVYRDAVVKVNGAFAAQRPGGYTLFHVSLDPYLHYGEENVITVEAQAHNDSRWYSGGGITRPVHLLLGPLIHIAPTGIQVTTPEIDDELAVVEVAVPVVNGSNATATTDARIEILDPDDVLAATGTLRVSTLAGETQTGRRRLYIQAPQRWSTDSPALYTARVTLGSGDAEDTAEARFGIRSLRLDPIHGLRLNGRTVNLHGACVHNDNGVLAGACIAAAEDRRVRLLKAAGFNALRSSHNPMSVAMLEACDRHGMLVMDETWDVWTDAKTTDDYSLAFPEWWDRDVESLVAKDLNHPSVILYSIGNEIPEIGTPHGARRARAIAEKLRSLDSSRYVLNSLNAMMTVLDELAQMREQAGQGSDADSPAEGADSGAGDINTAMTDADDMMSAIMSLPEITDKITEAADAVDILGHNYADVRYRIEHEADPNRVIVGSETFSTRIATYWRLVQELPYVIGDFTWTGWDYLGEAGIARPIYSDDQASGMGAAYPYLLAGSGDIDILGDRKTISLYREVAVGLRKKPVLAVQRPEHFTEPIAPHSWTWTDSVASWTWDVPTGSPVTVEAYADADEVAFLVNGAEVARTPVGTDLPFYAKADTTYQPGELTVVAYRDGQELGRTSLETAGPVAALKAEVEAGPVRADDASLAFVPISLLDAAGRLNPAADRPVTVEVAGPAVLQGLGSARPSHEESFLSDTFTTYQGRALAVIRPTGIGKVTVRVSGDDLGTEVSFTVEP